MDVQKRLAEGNDDAWGEVFPILFAVAFAVAQSRLRDKFASECEDVAQETLIEIAKNKSRPTSEGELKALTGRIACAKAADRVRRHLAAKRGGKITESLNEIIDAEPLAQSVWLENISVASDTRNQ